MGVSRAQDGTVVYTPESALRRPGELLRGMARDLAASRELAWRLLVRNLAARYRQTLLGYLWAVLVPLVWTGVFVFLRHSGVLGTADAGAPYVVFLLTGMVLWQSFAESLTAPLRAVTQSAAMLTKIRFPPEALMLAGAGEVLVNFLIRAVLVLAVFLWFQVIPPPAGLLAPAGALILMGLGLALGMLLLPLAVLYRDIEQMLSMLLPVWMFLTPVLYAPPASRPAPWTTLVNPVAPVLEGTRAWMLGGMPEYPGAFLLVGMATVLALLCAWILYRVSLPLLIERMSA